MPTDRDAGAPAAPSSRMRSEPGIPDATITRRNGSQRRWAAVGVLAVGGLLAILAHEISARTAIMLAGTILCVALSADRLDHSDA